MGASPFGSGSTGGGSGPGGDFEGVLDGATIGLVGAWSVARRLLTAYTGPLIRVRRASDDAEADISADEAGGLDLSALAAFTSSGSAYVQKIYDQAGSVGHIAQATAAKQPRIISSGVLDTENDQPVCVFDGSDDVLTIDYTGGSAATFYLVAKLNAAGFYPMMCLLVDSSIELRGYAGTGQPELNNGGTTCQRATSAVGLYGQYTGAFTNPGTSQAWLDDTPFAAAVSSPSGSISIVRLGARAGGFNASMDFSELYLYNAQHDATTRQGIQEIQKDHFGTA